MIRKSAPVQYCIVLKLFLQKSLYLWRNQARRHAGHSGAVPPKITAYAPQTRIAPPKRGLRPKEINRLGATGVQFEAKISVITLEFVSKNWFFVDFAISTVCFCGFTPGVMKIHGYFGTKIFF